MTDLTPERLAELRRIAEAATPGPWAVNPFKALVDEMATLTPVCAMLWPTELRTEEQTLSNALHIAAFDPTTVLALLDRIEALEAVLRLVYDEFVLDVARWCRHCRLRIDDHAPECPMTEVERVLGL